MNTKRNIMKHAGTIAKALTLGSAALIALSGSVQAQIVDGSSSVNMGGTAANTTSGSIIGLNTINFPSLTSTATDPAHRLPWTNPFLSGYVVPAGQLTGIAMDGSNIAFLDLVPIKAQSLSVASSTDVTADVVQINQNGITTGGLSILDSTSVDGDSNPVARPITVDNGQLMVGGTAVSAAGPTDTVNILDQTAVDTNNDPLEQALTVDNGELMLNGELVVPPADKTPLNMVEVTRADGTKFWAGRTEVTFDTWVNTLRWSLQNGYTYDAISYSSDELLGVTINGTAVQVEFTSSAASNRTAPGVASSFDSPVVQVNRSDVVKWCNALSERSNLDPVFMGGTVPLRTGAGNLGATAGKNGYRMLNPDEMALLAQGTSVADSNINGGQPLSRAWPVGRSGASDLGAYDVHGNVWEFTSQWYARMHPYRFIFTLSGGSYMDSVAEGANPLLGEFEGERYIHDGPNQLISVNTRYPNVGFRIMRNVD